MSEALSNVNLNSVNLTGNTGTIASYLEPSLITAVVLVPKNTIIPASALVSQTAFNTYITGTAHGFMSNTRTARWFALVNLDEFKEGTKQPSTDDTGLNQQKVIKYNPLYEFRYLTNMGNYIETLNFNNTQNYFNVFFIDLNGTWFGTKDPTGAGGLAPYTLTQFFVFDRMFLTDKKLNIYNISLQLSNRKQINEDFAYYAAGTDPLEINMPENLMLTDVTATLGTPLSIDATKTIVVTAKTGQGSTDWIQEYGSAITASVFKCYNLTAAASASIASIAIGTIVVAGQTYNYATIVLSSAPTAADQVQVYIDTISAVNAIIPNADVVIDYTPGTAAINACIHTF